MTGENIDLSCNFCVFFISQENPRWFDFLRIERPEKNGEKYIIFYIS